MEHDISMKSETMIDETTTKVSDFYYVKNGNYGELFYKIDSTASFYP